MGFDFHNEHGGYFSLNWSGWRMVFELATAYGWKPEGTEPPDACPDSREWDGSYFWNDYQWVTEADAMSLARALERAVAELPDEDLCPTKKLKLKDGRGREIDVEFLADNAEDDPKLYWSGAVNKAHLQGFIDFCKDGGFVIG